MPKGISIRLIALVLTGCLVLEPGAAAAAALTREPGAGHSLFNSSFRTEALSVAVSSFLQPLLGKISFWLRQTAGDLPDEPLTAQGPDLRQAAQFMEGDVLSSDSPRYPRPFVSIENIKRAVAELRVLGLLPTRTHVAGRLGVTYDSFIQLAARKRINLEALGVVREPVDAPDHKIQLRQEIKEGIIRVSRHTDRWLSTTEIMKLLGLKPENLPQRVLVLQESKKLHQNGQLLQAGGDNQGLTYEFRGRASDQPQDRLGLPLARLVHSLYPNFPLKLNTTYLPDWARADLNKLEGNLSARAFTRRVDVIIRVLAMATGRKHSRISRDLGLRVLGVEGKYLHRELSRWDNSRTPLRKLSADDQERITVIIEGLAAVTGLDAAVWRGEFLQNGMTAERTGGSWSRNPKWVRIAWMDSVISMLLTLGAALFVLRGGWGLFPSIEYRTWQYVSGFIWLIYPAIFYLSHSIANRSAMVDADVLKLTFAKLSVAFLAMTPIVLPVGLIPLILGMPGMATFFFLLGATVIVFPHASIQRHLSLPRQPLSWREKILEWRLDLPLAALAVMVMTQWSVQNLVRMSLAVQFNPELYGWVHGVSVLSLVIDIGLLVFISVWLRRVLHLPDTMGSTPEVLAHLERDRKVFWAFVTGILLAPLNLVVFLKLGMLSFKPIPGLLLLGAAIRKKGEPEDTHEDEGPAPSPTGPEPRLRDVKPEIARAFRGVITQGHKHLTALSKYARDKQNNEKTRDLVKNVLKKSAADVYTYENRPGFDRLPAEVQRRLLIVQDWVRRMEEHEETRRVLADGLGSEQDLNTWLRQSLESLEADMRILRQWIYGKDTLLNHRVQTPEIPEGRSLLEGIRNAEKNVSGSVKGVDPRRQGLRGRILDKGSVLAPLLISFPFILLAVLALSDWAAHAAATLLEWIRNAAANPEIWPLVIGSHSRKGHGPRQEHSLFHRLHKMKQTHRNKHGPRPWKSREGTSSVDLPVAKKPTEIPEREASRKNPKYDSTGSINTPFADLLNELRKPRLDILGLTSLALLAPVIAALTRRPLRLTTRPLAAA